MAKKKFVVQRVCDIDDYVKYMDVLDGDKDTKDQAEQLIDDLIGKVPLYDYRIDERYER